MQELSGKLHKIFCRRVREVRTRLGLSQAEVAKRMGVSRVRITQIENGTWAPSLDGVERVAAALGVKAGTLINEPRKKSAAT